MARQTMGGVQWSGCPASGLYHMQDPDLIPAARRQGLAVNVWTVNEEPHMEMLMQQKVDAIITNRPDLCRRVVDRYTDL